MVKSYQSLNVWNSSRYLNTSHRGPVYGLFVKVWSRLRAMSQKLEQYVSQSNGRVTEMTLKISLMIIKMSCIQSFGIQYSDPR